MSRPRRATLFAPLAAGGLLAAMVAVLGVRAPQAPPGYLEAVAEAIDAVPYISGPWTGVDTAVTPAAVELLRPNKLLQRRYTDLARGEWFDLLIVHCGDVRDMIGHFPPVCYPAAGWSMGERTPRPVSLGGRDADALDYRFAWPEDPTVAGIVVTSVFAVPAPGGVMLDPDRAAIERAGRLGTTAKLGAAQVQVVTPADIPEDRRREAVERAARLVEPVIDAIGKDAA